MFTISIVTVNVSSSIDEAVFDARCRYIHERKLRIELISQTAKKNTIAVAVAAERIPNEPVNHSFYHKIFILLTLTVFISVK